MKNTVYFASAMIAERLVSFLLLPLLTKIISPTEYAIWSQSIIISGIMIPVVLLGFQTAVVKFFPMWEGQGELKNSVLLFMLLVILVFITLIAGIALLFDQSMATIIFGKPKYDVYIPLLVGMLFSEALFEFLVGILRATNRIRQVSLYLFLKGVWRLGILVLVLFGMSDGFYYAFWVFVLFQLAVTFLIYVKEVNFGKIVKSGIGTGRSYWKEILRFSLPLLPLAALTATNNFIDRIFLTQLHGLDMVATYSASFSLAAIVAFFYSVLGFTLFPVLSKYWANNDMTGVASLLRNVLIVYQSLLIPFLVFMVVIGNDVLIQLTNENYAVTPLLLFLLTCNIGLFGFYQIAFYLLLLQKGSMRAPVYMATAVGLNIIFNTLLVPEYGMMGAAFAGFVSNLFLAGVFLYMSHQILRWSFPWKSTIRISIRALMMGAIIWFGVQWFGIANPILLFTILAVAGFVYGLFDYFDKQTSFFNVIRNY